MANQVEKSQREIALDIIMEVLEQGKFSHVVIKHTLDEVNLTSPARKLITRIAEGTIERMITLDILIQRFSKIKVNKMKPVIRNVLRMSVYQMKYMDNIPESAICNEAVKLVKRRGLSQLSGFVNGVLREMLRHPERLELHREAAESEITWYSVFYSMPEWLVEHFVSVYGSEKAEAILKGLTEAGSTGTTTVRIRQELVQSEEKLQSLIEELKQDAEHVSRSPYAQNALLLGGYDRLARIPAFGQGLLQVQNLSSILVGNIAGIKKGDVCLDLCSAPGGKAIHLADLLEGTGQVIARDVSEKKCTKIEENVKRCGVGNIRIEVWDALEFDVSLEQACDFVLVDAPCSGFGVLGDKPEIKYRVRKEDLHTLPELSKKILKNAVRYVKPGGTLLFSTCTLNPKENTEIRQWLMQTYTLTPVDFRDCLSAEFLEQEDYEKTAGQGYLQIVPGQGLHGFFICRFRKE